MGHAPHVGLLVVRGQGRSGFVFRTWPFGAGVVAVGLRSFAVAYRLLTVLTGVVAVHFCLQAIHSGRLAIVSSGSAPTCSQRPGRDQIGAILGRVVTVPAAVEPVDVGLSTVTASGADVAGVAVALLGDPVSSLRRPVTCLGSDVGFLGIVQQRLDVDVAPDRSPVTVVAEQVTTISVAVPGPGDPIALVSREVALVGHPVALIGHPIPLHGSTLPLIHLACLLALSRTTYLRRPYTPPHSP
jgi:hypothetical protein